MAQEAVIETDPTRRIEKLLALRSLASQLLHDVDEDRYLDEHGIAPRKALARFIVETAYIAYLNGDHSRGEGGLGWMPTHVTEMPEFVSGELVGLRLTEPGDWIEALHTRMSYSASLAETMVRSAGGFDQEGGAIDAQFLHVGSVLDWRAINQNAVGDEVYDPLTYRIVREDRYNACYQLLRQARPARPLSTEEAAQLHDVRSGFWSMEMTLVERAAAWAVAIEQLEPNERVQKAGHLPYNEQDKEAMLHLGGQPQWPAHLYVWAVMARYPTWRDPDVIGAIVAHQNPVSLRFLARSGMIDPALVPEPAKDPYETPSGARVIPSSRATSRPAAAGRD